MMVAGFFLMYFFVIFLGTGLVVLSIRHHWREWRRKTAQAGSEKVKRLSTEFSVQDEKGNI